MIRLAVAVAAMAAPKRAGISQIIDAQQRMPLQGILSAEMMDKAADRVHLT